MDVTVQNYYFITRLITG